MISPTPELDDLATGASPPPDMVSFNLEWALRYLANQAKLCRDRDAHEALCLLLPALCKCFKLSPADDLQAIDFEAKFHRELRWRIERRGIG